MSDSENGTSYRVFQENDMVFLLLIFYSGINCQKSVITSRVQELSKNVSHSNTSIAKATVVALMNNNMIPLLVQFLNKEEDDDIILIYIQ